MELRDFVSDFAVGIMMADALRPQWRRYQPGLGPHSEDAVVRLTLAQLRSTGSRTYDSAGPVRYPKSRLRCDIVVGAPPEWAIEVKMARPLGDNGRSDDNYLKDLLSPYPADRSALTDADKLRHSGFTCRKAIIVYGFDADGRELEPVLEVLEVLLRWQGTVSNRVEAAFHDLVHPVHVRGRVVGWEVL